MTRSQKLTQQALKTNDAKLAYKLLENARTATTDDDDYDPSHEIEATEMDAATRNEMLKLHKQWDSVLNEWFDKLRKPMTKFHLVPHDVYMDHMNALSAMLKASDKAKQVVNNS